MMLLGASLPDTMLVPTLPWGTPYAIWAAPPCTFPAPPSPGSCQHSVSGGKQAALTQRGRSGSQCRILLDPHSLGGSQSDQRWWAVTPACVMSCSTHRHQLLSPCIRLSASLMASIAPASSCRALCRVSSSYCRMARRAPMIACKRRGGRAPSDKGVGCPVALDICCHPCQLCPFPRPGSGTGTPCGCTSGTLQVSKEPWDTAVPTLMPGTAAFSTSRVTRTKPRRLSPPGSVMMVSRFLHKGAKERD